MVHIQTEEELISLGEILGRKLKGHTVITLTGDLGAGKTTFTKGIGKGLDIKRIINSPTFTILKVYEGRLTLNHFDAYRLEDSDDDLGFEEIFDDEGVSVIEWPHFIDDIIPKERLEIEIIKENDNTRTLTFNPIGTYYQQLVKEVEESLC